MQNVGKLAGRTIFISGASRGIGKAIALKCAKDGANVVVAAKTVVAHPKLPGTIFTAAAEIEAAGGQALPLEVDIRYEDSVKQAVADTVKRFGGIDILINNASAINLIGTLDLDMKRFDLMHQINTRGTFLCSKYCVPHLKKGSNPHILNLSPPLNMNPRWFKDHVGYTMAKYGMSLCVLGMSEEFKEDKIAVNALWPKTGIYTAAMEMLGGGAAVKSQCRNTDIMADAAYAILTKDSGNYTGNFCIDEDVLRQGGMTNFDQYAFDKEAVLLPDFFLDGESPDAIRDQMKTRSVEKPDSSSTPSTANPDLNKSFEAIKALLSPDLVSSVGGVFQFDLKDDGEWYIDLKNGSGAVGRGASPQDADCTMTLSGENFVQMVLGKINPTTAFMSGKLKIKGNIGVATKLEKVMKQARAKL